MSGSSSSSLKSTIRARGRVADNLEQTFLCGVEAQIRPLLGSPVLPGSVARLQRRNEAGALREEMFKRGMGDPEVFGDLPLSGSLTWTLQSPRWPWLPWFFYKTSRTVSAAVWNDVAALLAGQPARPATADDLRAVVRGLSASTGIPHTVAVCSASGFGDDVQSGLSDLAGVALVLVEPDPGRPGNWRVFALEADVPEALRRAFDPETDQGKTDRVRDAVAGSEAELATGGLSAHRLADRLDVPAALVTAVFKQLQEHQPDLRTVRMAGDVLLVRGVSREMEGTGMWDWLKRLLGSRDTPARKINALKERRAVLSAQRDRLYDEIAQLETKEKTLKAEGVAAESDIVRRRVAGQLAGVRKDIARQNATVSLLAAQIEQIATHLHNMELEEQGQVAGLPTAEEMQAQAAKAEQLFADVSAKREMAGAFDVGLDAALTSPEEADILKEFEAARAEKAEKPEEQATAEAGRVRLGEPSAAARQGVASASVPSSPASAPTKAADKEKA